MNQQEVALEYAKNGISVFPCNGDKEPLTKTGWKAATTDAQKIKRWWKRHPDALIGSPSEDYAVVDIDDYSVPEGAKPLMDHIKQRLDHYLLNDATFKVKTLSGGTHVYFKNVGIKRQIKSVAQVDLLGYGGYSILPDQRNYHFEGDGSPWKALSDLPMLNMARFEDFSEEVGQVSDFLKEAMQKAKKEKEGATQSIGEKSATQARLDEGLVFAAQQMRKSENPNRQCMSTINEKLDCVEFDIPLGIYAKTTKKFDAMDPTYPVLEDGPIRVAKNSMDTDQLMMLFHNVHVQEKLARLVGLEVPATQDDTVLMRSILPGHNDRRKSMGVRWNEKKTHIIARDFSNFFGDKFGQCDFNVVRLYAIQKYGVNVPRMNGPEFAVWLNRMLVECGVFNIGHLYRNYWTSVSAMSERYQHTLERFRLLDAIKWTYKDYEGETVFADKFSSAWCEATPTTIRRHKAVLVEKGYLEVVGMYDCSGGKRADGFFNTKLYRLATEKPHDFGKKAKEEKSSEPAKKQTEEKPEERTEMNANEEKINIAYHDIGTYLSVGIDSEDYKRVFHFLEDIGLEENAVPQDLMRVALAVSDQYRELVVPEDRTFFMDKFMLVESQAENGSRILMAFGNCPPLTKIQEDFYNSDQSVLDEETGLALVIATDIEPSFELDISQLELTFNEYIKGRVSLSDVGIQYAHFEDIVEMLDGFRPELDD